ncbi:MAG: hypothetical protein NC489_30175 [Ruminococcus flavefaciens]|nr:hypothetical protein [Ruminococcus flavefaciens]
MAKSQAAFYRLRSSSRLVSMITANFESAQLLTLRYAPGVPVPRPLADSQYFSLMHSARRIAGGAFDYVRVTDYGPAEAPQTVHRLITDLPSDICRKIASSWFMGESTVEPLNAAQLASLASELMIRPEDAREKGRKTWAASRSLVRRRCLRI